jgi:hypothetical protein
MAIGSVGSSANSVKPDTNLLGKLQSQLETNVANAAQKAKQDSVLLSEKAKDLIAQQNANMNQIDQNVTETPRTKRSLAD